MNIPHVLTLLIFSPLIGIFIAAIVPRRYEEGIRPVALFSTLVSAALTYYLWTHFSKMSLFSFAENTPWIPQFGINYHVGADGLSLLMIALTALLTPLAVLISWDEIKTRRKEFYSLILACQLGLFGLFAARDLFLFYVFWEVMLIPMYFLIGIWGSGNRVHVALKFLLYTVLGSVVMLVGLVYLCLATGNNFDMASLGHILLPENMQIWLFLAFGLAFAIKMPLVPFHTWLPDAHTEAPTAASVLLAGLFLKAGAYGFARIALPYFPHAVAYFREAIFVIAVVGIIYGALVSMVQKDLKRLIAYSSVSHLGFVMLGLIALNHEGVMGAFLQMFNHGVSTGALFILFGVLYARSHTRDIGEMTGVARSMKLFSAIFIFVGLSSLGLPGLNNFAGEILVLFGAARSHLPYAVISASCIVFAAIYILWAVHRVFFGRERAAYKDIKGHEIAAVVPLIIVIIWLGVFPKSVLSKVGASATDMIEKAKRAIAEEPRESLNIIIPEIRKRIPDFIMPEIPQQGIAEPNLDETIGSEVQDVETGEAGSALPKADETGNPPGEDNSFYPQENPQEQFDNE